MARKGKVSPEVLIVDPVSRGFDTENLQVEQENLVSDETTPLDTRDIAGITYIDVDTERDHSVGIITTGSVPTERDEWGNILLYEDPVSPGFNEESYTQYVGVSLYDKIYDVDETLKAIDFEITELSKDKTSDEELDEFFGLFNRLKELIPLTGDTNSVEYIINQTDSEAFISADEVEDLQDTLIETEASLSLSNEELLIALQESSSLASINVALQDQIDALTEALGDG